MSEAAKAETSGASDLGKTIAGKYLTFNLGDEEYGLEILRVREIIGVMDIRPVPRTPEFILGVINLRGKVIPVVDLRNKFNMDFREHDERTCIIVLEAKQASGPVMMGILVDKVNDVTDVKADEIEGTPSFGMSLDTAFIKGMAKVTGGVKVLLDIDKVLTGDELSAMSDF